jgi:hypothetical protein
MDFARYYVKPSPKEHIMKKLTLTVCLILGLLIAPMAMADQVKLVGGSGYGPYQTGQGGEFTFRILDSNLDWILNSYVVEKTSDLVGAPYLHNFQTFCVERNEYVHANEGFDVTIGNTTIFGGKPLTQGAAWLYHEFQTGKLDYDYATGGTDTGELQNTIWWAMGLANTNGDTNQFGVLVKNKLGDAWDDENNGLYPVAILHLWVPGLEHTTDNARQDQLVCVPVPEPGILILLGIALSAVGLGARRYVI